MSEGMEKAVEFVKQHPAVLILGAGGVVVLYVLSKGKGTSGAPVDFGSVTYQYGGGGFSGGGGSSGTGNPPPDPVPAPLPSPGPGPAFCGPGQEWNGTVCVPIGGGGGGGTNCNLTECPPGLTCVNGVCVSINVPPGPVPHHCPPWEVWDEGQQRCVGPFPTKGCDPGYHWNGTTCVPDGGGEGIDTTSLTPSQLFIHTLTDSFRLAQ